MRMGEPAEKNAPVVVQGEIDAATAPTLAAALHRKPTGSIRIVPLD